MSGRVLIGLVISIFVIISAVLFTSFRESKTSGKLISPWVELGVVANNLWVPKKASASTVSSSPPQINAQAAYFVEADSGEVLFAKNEHLKLPIASLVKIMTLIVTLENHNWQDQFLVSAPAASMEPDKMQLIAGEKLTLEELIDGIILVSANDAAQVLAEQTLPSYESFIKAMNSKAKQLGMNDTKFINPTGLEEDAVTSSQYSSAYDSALMSRFLIKQYPHVLDISSKERIYLSSSEKHQDYDLYSGINLVTTYPGVIGLKTGFTPEAGYTLVTVARRGGKTVIGVILNSNDRRDEARMLLDYSFKILGV